MYIGATSRVSNLLCAVGKRPEITIVTLGRSYGQVTPTATKFSHQSVVITQRTNKNAKLLCREASNSWSTSQRSTGLAYRIGTYERHDLLLSCVFAHNYSCDKFNESSCDNNDEMARDPASEQLTNYKKNLKVRSIISPYFI